MGRCNWSRDPVCGRSVYDRSSILTARVLCIDASFKSMFRHGLSVRTASASKLSDVLPSQSSNPYLWMS